MTLLTLPLHLTQLPWPPRLSLTPRVALLTLALQLTWLPWLPRLSLTPQMSLLPHLPQLPWLSLAPQSRPLSQQVGCIAWLPRRAG